MFKVYLDPFDGEPDDADEFYALVGRCTILWGHVDTTVEGMLSYLMDIPSAAEVREPEIPISFKRKMRLWRKAYNRMPELADAKSAAIKFANEAARLSEQRQTIIHSTIAFEKKEPKARGIRYRQRGDKTLYWQFRISKDYLTRHMNELQNLLRMLDFPAMHALFLIVSINYQKQSKR
ncbi:MAG: hypothetical protein WD711_13455 [Dongiaceae bacterium]